MKKHQQQLKKYIRNAQRLGFSVKAITDALLLVGWTKKQIKDGFEFAAEKQSIVMTLFFAMTRVIRKTSFKFLKFAGYSFKTIKKLFIFPIKLVGSIFVDIKVKKIEKIEKIKLEKKEKRKKEEEKINSLADGNKEKSMLLLENKVKFLEEFKPEENELKIFQRTDFKKPDSKKEEISKKQKFRKIEFKRIKTKKNRFSAMKTFLKVLFFIPKAILLVLSEIREIIRGDIIFVKQLGLTLKKKSILEVEVIRKEPKYVLDSIHFFWHYTVRFVEYLFDFIQNSAFVIIKLAMLPFVILSFLIPKKLREKTKEKIQQSQRPESGKEQGAESLRGMEFPEKILFIDILRLAKRMFETRRLRTFLTILGTGVGVGAILFLVSLGYGLQNVLFERIASEDALLTLDAFAPTGDVDIKLDDSLISSIESNDSVDSVGRIVAIDGGISVGDLSVVATINVLDNNFKSMFGGNFIVGDFSENGGVVVSQAITRLLDLESPEDVMGKSVSVFILIPSEEEFVSTFYIEKEFEVVGVVGDNVSSFIYFPLEEVKDVALPAYTQIKVKAIDGDSVGLIKEYIVSFGLQVAAISDTLEQAKKVFSIARIVLGVFGIITLIVSAIGMLNTMTIALLERTQEVGIMKSIGASNADVWKLFLSESIIMGFLGGIGGIAIGYLGSELFNYGINLLAQAFGGQALDLFQQPIWFVVTIVIFAAVIGLITGLLPAKRAAGLDPLVALKGK